MICQFLLLNIQVPDKTEEKKPSVQLKKVITDISCNFIQTFFT